MNYLNTLTKADVPAEITFKREEDGRMTMHTFGPDWAKLRADLDTFLATLPFKPLSSGLGLPLKRPPPENHWILPPPRTTRKPPKEPIGFWIVPPKDAVVADIPKTWEVYDGSKVPIYVEETRGDMVMEDCVLRRKC